MQKIILTGNLGRDPEMRYTPSGQAVTSFSVAVTESYTNKSGENVKKTAWFRCAAWGKQAEICNQYLKKGSKVLVEGQMDYDVTTGAPKLWTKQDGSTGTAFEVRVMSIEFLSSRQAESGMVETAQEVGGDTTDEDLPF